MCNVQTVSKPEITCVLCTVRRIVLLFAIDVHCCFFFACLYSGRLYWHCWQQWKQKFLSRCFLIQSDLVGPRAISCSRWRYFLSESVDLAGLLASVACGDWWPPVKLRVISFPSRQWGVASSEIEFGTFWPVSVRVPTGPGKSWNSGRAFSRPGKSWKTAEVMEKSWKMMTVSWNFYNCSEKFSLELSLLILVCIHKSLIVYLETICCADTSWIFILFGHGKVMENNYSKRVGTLFCDI